MDWGVSLERISFFWRVGSHTREDVQADRQFDHSSVCQLAELGAVRFVFLFIERHWRRTARQHLWKSCSNPEACRQFTKSAQATGLENIGPERKLSDHLGNVPVNSPTRITLENNGKIRRKPDRENSFTRASGGGSATAIQPSVGLEPITSFLVR